MLFKRIAFVGWEPEDDHLVDRFHGYKNAVEKDGSTFQPKMNSYSSLSIEGGYQATVKLFERFRPDAILYTCDRMAVSYLLERLNGKINSPQEDKVSITPKLVIRSSTK